MVYIPLFQLDPCSRTASNILSIEPLPRRIERLKNVPSNIYANPDRVAAKHSTTLRSDPFSRVKRFSTLRACRKLRHCKLSDRYLAFNVHKFNTRLEHSFTTPADDNIAEATVAYCFIVRNLSSI